MMACPKSIMRLKYCVCEEPEVARGWSRALTGDVDLFCHFLFAQKVTKKGTAKSNLKFFLSHLPAPLIQKICGSHILRKASRTWGCGKEKSVCCVIVQVNGA